MATIDKHGHITGPLGGLRFYSLNGKNIVATKGGPTANQIKKSENYAYTRAHNAEFGIVSKLASVIFQSHQMIRPFRHHQAYQILRGNLFRLFPYDETNQHGQRSLLFSKAIHHFDQMQLSAIPYAEYVTLPVEWNRNNPEEVNFQIKASSIRSMFRFPKNYHQVNWTLYVQGIKDIEFNQTINGYTLPLSECVLPLTPVSSFQFANHETGKELFCSAPLEKDYNYLIFAVASYTPFPKPNLSGLHMAACIGLVSNLSQ